MNQRNEPKSSEVDQSMILEWVRLANDGNQEAFTKLYDHFLPSVYKRVWYVIPVEEVEDVTQEIFMAMMRSLKSFRGDSKFSTWLRVITNRQVANFYRSRNRTKPEMNIAMESAEEMNLPELGDNSATQTQDDILLLKQGLSGIPRHYQEILLLRFAEGMSFQEVADNLDKSLDAAKSLFRRALEALRNEIGDDLHV